MRIERRRQKLYVLLSVPPSLQGILGRARFVASLGTDNRQVAERRAAVKVAGWLGQIERARGVTGISADAAWWRQALEDASDDHQRDLVRSQLADEARQRVERAASARGIVDDRDPAYADLPELAEAMKLLKQTTAVPFAEHLEPWIASQPGLQAKSLAAKRSDVLEAAKVFPFVQEVSRKAVQKWAVGLLEDGMKRPTMVRKLSSLRGYWAWLAGKDIVSEELEPFDKLKLPRSNGKAQNGEKVRAPFDPADVVKLLQMAQDEDDTVLTDLIRLGMWTGARIEELAAMKVEHVDLVARAMTIIDAKSPAGNRSVPIHSRLQSTVERLVRDTRDGYILSGLTVNKFGDRSGTIGQRFGRLKRRAGFGKELVFHSIRKTVTTLLERTGVLEGVAADIVGHEKQTLTYGLYSHGSSIEQKREAIEKLAYPV